MKIVVNREFGGFSLPETFCKEYGFSAYDDIDRTDARLVRFIENNGGEVEVFCGTLEVAEIPDKSTDWELNDYDGMESIIYVVDGKIHWA